MSFFINRRDNSFDRAAPKFYNPFANTVRKTIAIVIVQWQRVPFKYDYYLYPNNTSKKLHDPAHADKSFFFVDPKTDQTRTVHEIFPHVLPRLNGHDN